MLANSQCLLKISAGLDFPSFQLNWRYPAAMASLTLWYDANVDFFVRGDVGPLLLHKQFSANHTLCEVD